MKSPKGGFFPFILGVFSLPTLWVYVKFTRQNCVIMESKRIVKICSKSFIISLLAVSLIQCNRNKSNIEPALTSIVSTSCLTFENEDAIDLGPHVLDTNTAKVEAAAFNPNVVTSATGTLPLLIETIAANAFCKLKDSADALKSRDTCSHYVTGIRLIFGLNSNFNEVTLLYQPVFLCRISSESGYGSYAIDEYNGSGYYYYNRSSSSFEITTDASSFHRYRDSILISHTPNDAYSHFRYPSLGNDTLTDVRSVIYTFQEIAALITDNGTTPYVKLWNTVQNINVPSAGTVVRKHAVLLGPDHLHVTGGSSSSPCSGGGFCDAFANLQGMCPPGCIKLIYAVE
jgi:hypothetical protein